MHTWKLDFSYIILSAAIKRGWLKQLTPVTSDMMAACRCSSVMLSLSLSMALALGCALKIDDSRSSVGLAR